ncbi:MAG TPA: hypothetical protein VHM02_03030, partial [Thermoanaerobaculia bacterium]|nr:hypothetical protein [Thermoanaerobaculia bacterium]
MRALVVSALLLAALPGEAAEPVLDVELPAGEVHVGDLVPLTLVLDPDGAELAAPPRFPAWGDGWGAAEVVETGEPASTIDEGGREVYRQRVVLQAFRPGELALPPVEVAVPLAEGTRTLATPADLAVTVASVLPPVPAEAGTEAEAIPPPQPAAPPMPLPVGAAFWWAAGIGTALLAALLVTLLLRRRRGAEGAGARPLLAPVAELS